MTHVCMPVLQHTCGSQRTSMWGRIFPPTSMWVLGIKFRAPGFQGKHPYLLSCLAGPTSLSETGSLTSPKLKLVCLPVGSRDPPASALQSRHCKCVLPYLAFHMDAGNGTQVVISAPARSLHPLVCLFDTEV